MNANIRDGVGRNKKLCSLSHVSFRVWSCAVSAGDGFGLVRSDPWEFRMDAMPGVQITDDEISSALEELDRGRLIHRYRVAGHGFLLLHDWFDHNPHLRNLKFRPKHPMPSSVKCACFDDWGQTWKAIMERSEKLKHRVAAGGNGRGPCENPLLHPEKYRKPVTP